MTEEWWQEYKRKKERNKNLFFDEVESEMKRRFKSEKSPDEMYSMCRTDNNYWKQYRSSENLDDETIGLVLCKNIGCDLMYCQALTFAKNSSSRGIETFGCKEQFDTLRSCYLRERRRFNSLYKEEDWRVNRNLIPEYLKKELAIQKSEMVKYNNMSMPEVVVPSTIEENQKTAMKVNSKDGYF